MRKLRLDPDQLQVESFKTAPELPAHGTVLGHATDLEFTQCTCGYGQCTGNYYTCDAQCDTVSNLDLGDTCNLDCGGGGGTFTVTGHTACLDCFSQAQGCTAIDGCHTSIETCFPCG